MSETENISYSNDLRAYYGAKPASYFSGIRRDYVAALDVNPEASILEIGCAEGRTGALALSENKCGRYVGVELHEESAQTARKVLTEVHVGNVETMELPFANEGFDALILSEVLEHLIDPWSVCARLAQLVRPGGRIFASSPNVSHHKVIRQLIKGRWDLADRGVMDRTHMRWFTPHSYRAMFEQVGFSVERLDPVTPNAARVRMINWLTANRFSHLFIIQMSIQGRKQIT
ncbi:MAG: class I SAM-dependent methyltransferase [Pseudomonadota bacterium]